MEDSLDSNTPTTKIELKVDPPLSTDGRRRSRNTIRAASAWRKQLVILMVDNSGSMRDFDKAKFATDAAREISSHLQHEESRDGLFRCCRFWLW